MIQATTFRRTFHTTTGATSYATGIVAQASSDLKVYYHADRTSTTDPVLWVLGTNYTLSGIGSSAGVTVQNITAVATGGALYVYRDAAKTQLSDFVRNVTPDSDVLETSLDKLALSVQELHGKLEMSVHMPWQDYPEATSGSPPLANLPTSNNRKNKLLGFDSTGQVILHAIDVGALTITPPNTVNTADIVNGAVTEAKLASALDLSSKTLTLPSGQVTAANLASSLDLSSKTLTFPSAFIYGTSFRDGSVYRDHFSGEGLGLQYLRVGAANPSFVVTGAGTVSAAGTYTHSGTLVDSRPKYTATNGSYIQWYSGGGVWAIYDSANTRLYTSIPGNVQSTPEQVGSQWQKGSGDLGSLPAPATVYSGNPVEVTGNVKATSFEGDISRCTGGQVAIPVLALPQYHCVESYSASLNYGNLVFVGSDGRVHANGTQNNAWLRSTTGAIKSLIRPIFKNGQVTVPNVTDNLNGGVDFITQVVQGSYNLLALSYLGNVYAIGLNTSGQLGQGNTTTYQYFQAIYFNDGGSNAVISQIYMHQAAANTSGDTVSCFAVDTSGRLWSWGENSNGQLGRGDALDKTTPALVSGLSGKVVLKVAQAGASTWILCDDGSVYSCGWNSSGSLAIGNTTQTTTPTLVPNTGTTLLITDVVASGSNNGGDTTAVCMLAADGKVYTAGDDADGGVGNGGSTTDEQSLVDISASVGTAKQIFGLGYAHSCFLAVRTDNGVRVWGRNTNTHLGVSPTTTPANPTELTSAAQTAGGVLNVIHLGAAAGAEALTTIALLSDGSVWGCGANSSYELADGTTTAASTFRRLQVPKATSIAATGPSSWCMLDNLGRLWHAGLNAEYQGGQGHADALTTISQVRL